MAYYTTTIKPVLTASRQAAAAYADEDVLFDWTEVTLPVRGSLKLKTVTFVVRGTDGSRQEFGMDLLFSTSNAASMGAQNATASLPPSNSIIGNWKVIVQQYGDGLDRFSVGGSNSAYDGFVIPGQSSGKIYIGGICDGTPDFRSTVQVSTETATNTTAVVVKTTDARQTFAVGDVLADEDDQAIGTIKTITDDANLVLEENCASVSAINKDLYNTSPITIILGFEK